MGYRAVELLLEGKGNRVVGMHGDAIVDYDITEALEMKREFREDIYRMALEISI